MSGSFGTPSQLVFTTGLNTVRGDIGSSATGGATNGSTRTISLSRWVLMKRSISISINRNAGAGSGSFIGYVPSDSFLDQSGGDRIHKHDFLTRNIVASSRTAECNAPWRLEITRFGFQEVSGTIEYTVSFNVVTAVPEPSSAIALIGHGLAGLIRRRR